MDAFAHYKKVVINDDELPEVDEEEVAKHNTPEDLWLIIYGKVYDVTEWQHSHPGGDFILQDYGGKDASKMFRSVQHSPDALGFRDNFLIAKLKKKTEQKSKLPAKAAINEKPITTKRTTMTKTTPEKAGTSPKAPPAKPIKTVTSSPTPPFPEKSKTESNLKTSALKATPVRTPPRRVQTEAPTNKEHVKSKEKQPPPESASKGSSPSSKGAPSQSIDTKPMIRRLPKPSTKNSKL